MGWTWFWEGRESGGRKDTGRQEWMSCETPGCLTLVLRGSALFFFNLTSIQSFQPSAVADGVTYDREVVATTVGDQSHIGLDLSGPPRSQGSRGGDRDEGARVERGSKRSRRWQPPGRQLCYGHGDPGRVGEGGLKET